MTRRQYDQLSLIYLKLQGDLKLFREMLSVVARDLEREDATNDTLEQQQPGATHDH